MAHRSARSAERKIIRQSDSVPFFQSRVARTSRGFSASYQRTELTKTRNANAIFRRNFIVDFARQRSRVEPNRQNRRRAGQLQPAPTAKRYYSKAPSARANWFGTPRLATDQNKQIAAAFEKKYPGVSVDTFRTGSSALAQRLLTEAKARRYIADAIETTPPGLMTFRDSQLLLPYTSPHLAAFPEDAKERAPRSWSIGPPCANPTSACPTTSATSKPPMCRKISTA